MTTTDQSAEELNRLGNEQAFPLPPIGTGDPRDGWTSGATGLTKREYFAALICAALQGNSSANYDWEGAASDAVKQADALLAALNK